MKCLIYILIFVSVLGCSEDSKIKFNSILWKVERDLEFYPHREQMLDDIINRKIFIGKHYNEIVDSLGNPLNNGRIRLDSIYYQIVVEYDFDIDPTYAKNLKIQFNKDSIVENCSIEEYNHN